MNAKTGFIIFPAIDLLGGNCVRLKQGAKHTAKIYSTEPEHVAANWQAEGACYIHVVNLDGAFGDAGPNARVIQRIVQAVDIPIQLGGGVRSVQDAEKWLKLGVQRVIFGTIALQQPEVVRTSLDAFGAERIVVGLDARSNRVAIQGWEIETEVEILPFALELRDMGVERIVYTDVSRDGEGLGPNVATTLGIAEYSGLKVIASGGFATKAHFEAFSGAGNSLVEGAIVGTALYEKQLVLSDLIRTFQG